MKTHDLLSRRRRSLCSKEQVPTLRGRHAPKKVYAVDITGARRLGIRFVATCRSHTLNIISPQAPEKQPNSPTRSPKRLEIEEPRQETARKILRKGRAPRGCPQPGAPEEKNNEARKRAKRRAKQESHEHTQKIQPSARNTHVRGRERMTKVSSKFPREQMRSTALTLLCFQAPVAPEKHARPKCVFKQRPPQTRTTSRERSNQAACCAPGSSMHNDAFI